MIATLLTSIVIGPFWVEPIGHSAGTVDEYDIHRGSAVVMVVQLGNGWPELYGSDGLQVVPDLNDNDMNGSVWS